VLKARWCPAISGQTELEVTVSFACPTRVSTVASFQDGGCNLRRCIGAYGDVQLVVRVRNADTLGVVEGKRFDDFTDTEVPVHANFDAGTPVVLFQANPCQMIATSERFVYDVSKDGQRFLINTELKSGLTPMSVVVNWTASLNK
jgi:hypothetical protein